MDNKSKDSCNEDYTSCKVVEFLILIYHGWDQAVYNCKDYWKDCCQIIETLGVGKIDTSVDVKVWKQKKECLKVERP